MRRIVLSLLVLWLAAGVATADVNCAIDVRPARTLLLPYFSFDLKKLNKPGKAQATTVIINNHFDEEVIAHVTLWTDLSIPSVAWDIPLAPFGSQAVPIHEIFRGGRTDYPGIDPDNPGVAPPPDGRAKDDLRDFHTGRPVDGTCRSFNHGDKFARGYITIDAAFGSPIFQIDGASEPNALTGEVHYDNKKRRFSAVEPLIHLEANGRTEGPGRVWAVNYDIRSTSQTHLFVWREADSSELDQDAICDLPQPNGFFPLGQAEIVASDRDGNMQEILAGTPAFPLASGSYELGLGNLQLPSDVGTLYIDLSGAPGFVTVRQIFQTNRRQGRTGAVALAPIQCSSTNSVGRSRGR